MKTPAPSKPDWPPVIGSGITPFIRLRDTILTVIAWIFVVALLWELLELLWDYFDDPIFALTKTHSLSWLGLLDRIGNFALVSLLLVLWLAFWGFVRRKELRRTNDPRPVPALLLSEHAAAFGVPPEAIERWRQSHVVVVQFDAANRIENVTAKALAPPEVDPQIVEKGELS
jgi:poly-beta-1,6-N-acetyl-D-glucosamine biosynthesis protein PgaD